MKINWKKLIACIALPLIVGGLSALITRDAMEDFMSLPQPPLSPPAWLFPVVWTILYTLMGIASYLILESGADSEAIVNAASAYWFQLVLNFFWPLIFFNMQQFTIAAIWLGALLALVILTAVRFFHIRKTAGWLLVPYLVWLVFALYLNIGVAVLNP